jgi:hypothetical protein
VSANNDQRTTFHPRRMNDFLTSWTMLLPVPRRVKMVGGI